MHDFLGQTETWLVIPHEPPTSTHQAALRVLKSKTGKMFVGKMKNSKIVGWMRTFEPWVAEARPAKPMEGAVQVHIKLLYSPPKYLLRKIHKCKTIVKTTKPDCDNAVKVILDLFTKNGYWLDDSQVWSITIEKYWSIEPSVQVLFKQTNTQ